MSSRVRIGLLCLAVLALSACGATATAPLAPKIETVEVKVPVSTPCIVEAPARPLYAWGKGDYPGDKAAVGILLIDHERSVRYGKDWEAASTGCVRSVSESAAK